MNRLLESLLGSILVTVFAVAFLFFSAVRYLLRPEGLTDCSWQAVARAWVDWNADGRVDPYEPVLDDVPIYVGDMHNRLLGTLHPLATGRNGEVHLQVPIAGCQETVVEIFVDIPDGYRPTTQARLEVQTDLWDDLRAERLYYFGFVPER
jgi:hypothetical protein